MIGSGTGSCPSGYTCLWPNTNYGGRGVAFYGDETNFRALPSPYNSIQDDASSAYNNGRTHSVRLAVDANGGGNTFTLARGRGTPDMLRDLAGDMYDNKISSLRWFIP
jgi:hypothetical protein